MNTEWSLDVLYKGFDDPKYDSDKVSLEETIFAFKKYVSELPVQGNLSHVSELFKYESKINKLILRLADYAQLRQSTNTTDPKCATELGRLRKLNSSISKEEAIITKFIANIPNVLELIKESDELKKYTFRIEEILKDASHTLSDEVEEVIARLNLSAGLAWEDLQSCLTSTVEVDYHGEKVTLSAIRNLAYSPDADVRKEAYEAEIACYDKIKDAVAYSLNNIKSQVNTICELRGYSSPLSKTLDQCVMKQETLDAMFTAIDEYLPKFHEFLKTKGKVLGNPEGLPWYDLFAPFGESNDLYSLEEAKDFLVTTFREFSDDLADMVASAFEHEWIDFYPRNGKVGGAFCENLPYVKESRILTNYDGDFSSVVTLAHELGHAYHGLQIQDHDILNTDYSMPVAETASTFNEHLVNHAKLKLSSGKEKLSFLQNQLQDMAQIICDIYSRYLFEKTVFERRQSEFLFPDQLCEIMLNSQKKAYGDSIIESTLNPYMWVCKSHYYSGSTSYYNFPYAFGGLFSYGLFTQFQNEGKPFVEKYRALLHATTISSVEDVAKLADIDTTKPDFWRESLAGIAKLVDEFVELCKEEY